MVVRPVNLARYFEPFADARAVSTLVCIVLTTRQNFCLIFLNRYVVFGYNGYTGAGIAAGVGDGEGTDSAGAGDAFR